MPVRAHLLTRLAATRRCGEEPSRRLRQAAAREHQVQVALAGTTVRGTLGPVAPDAPSVHLVTLYDGPTGVVLAQQAVPEQPQELSLQAVLLTPPAVHGRIITADALPPHRVWCAPSTRFGGHALFLAQGNQPLLEEDLRLFWSRAPPGVSSVATGQSLREGAWPTGEARRGRQERTERVPRHGLAQRGPGLSGSAHRGGARANAPGNHLGQHPFVAAPSPPAPPSADP